MSGIEQEKKFDFNSKDLLINSKINENNIITIQMIDLNNETIQVIGIGKENTDRIIKELEKYK